MQDSIQEQQWCVCERSAPLSYGMVYVRSEETFFRDRQHVWIEVVGFFLTRNMHVGPGQSLDGRPDVAGSGVGGPVGGTLSSGLKNIPMPQGSDWGHCPVEGAVFRMGH